jgi:hypothetical protein
MMSVMVYNADVWSICEFDNKERGKVKPRVVLQKTQAHAME